MKSTALLLIAALGFAVSAIGQVTPLTPFQFTGDLYVSDSGNDNIYRLQDLNLDGDYNDANEVVTFYDDTIGAFGLTNNAGIAVGPEGTVYVCDTTLDFVLALRDQDGDGTAHGAGEAYIYFDGNPANNAGGIFLSSPQDLTVDADGVVWVANSGTGGGGTDAIYRMQDTGGPLGANDLGEATAFYTPAPASTNVGDSIPSDVKIGPDGAVYYTDNGATGVIAKGVYRLSDTLVPNGNANDPGEATPYFIPSALGANNFYWGFTFDRSGSVYLADNGNDVVWMGTDLNSDSMIAAGTAEESQFWTANGSSLNWTVEANSGVNVYTAESQSPDRILRMTDSLLPNGNANDPGETVAVYDETISPVNINNPRSLAFDRRPTLLADATPSIGSVATLSYLTTANRTLNIYYSTQATSIPFAPFGTLGLSVQAAPLFGVFLVAATAANGQFSIGIPVPNDPSLIGTTLYLQGFSGVSRVELTNLAAITFMP